MLPVVALLFVTCRLIPLGHHGGNRYSGECVSNSSNLQRCLWLVCCVLFAIWFPQGFIRLQTAIWVSLFPRFLLRYPGGMSTLEGYSHYRWPRHTDTLQCVFTFSHQVLSCMPLGLGKSGSVQSSHQLWRYRILSRGNAA